MAVTTENRTKLADYIRKHPEESFKSISEKLHCSLSTVSVIARDHGIHRKPRLMANLDMSLLDEEVK